MKVFDMDSHLREEYIMDEVYRLEGKFAHLTPVQALRREERPRQVQARIPALAERRRGAFQPCARL